MNGDAFEKWVDENIDELAQDMFDLGLFGYRDAVFITKILRKAFEAGKATTEKELTDILASKEGAEND